MRYLFCVSYKGGSYHGWQKQKKVLSVQEVIEEHLGTILRSEITIVGSGRTDTGVHARQQYFHADIPLELEPDIFKNKVNSFLPKDISINTIQRVKEDMHARFDAISRSYEYLIIREKDPFLEDFAYRFPAILSISEMNKAAGYLLGIHDFECFSRVKTDVKNFICEVTEAQWIENKETGDLKFQISANRFLRGMVRAVVGTMLDIGISRNKAEGIQEILKSKDRKAAGGAVPAKGLYLTKVIYPPSIFI